MPLVARGHLLAAIVSARNAVALAEALAEQDLDSTLQCYRCGSPGRLRLHRRGAGSSHPAPLCPPCFARADAYARGGVDAVEALRRSAT